MPGLKQQDLYHLESNLCQLCLQVKQSNLTARVSTWGCGHVQGGVASPGLPVLDLHACVCAFMHLCPSWGGVGGTMACCRCRVLLSQCLRPKMHSHSRTVAPRRRVRCLPPARTGAFMSAAPPSWPGHPAEADAAQRSNAVTSQAAHAPLFALLPC